MHYLKSLLFFRNQKPTMYYRNCIARCDANAKISFDWNYYRPFSSSFFFFPKTIFTAASQSHLDHHSPLRFGLLLLLLLLLWVLQIISMNHEWVIFNDLFSIIRSRLYCWITKCPSLKANFRDSLWSTNDNNPIQQFTAEGMKNVFDIWFYGVFFFLVRFFGIP